ncbi:PAS domain S-box-containing protein [Tangfeifania diversioriginum]|uniref:histidine kinase n=1 Tax=Tangfeifania diversioriginum TaxID=1168035 RepID=A0A1M6DNF1_9BACT|nr:ATP-binding protein [Tangfeifania diversioriginum]SHI74673.1 PAS domain S-box-containing protein [Tangfeifania diversioriginum]
MRAENILEALPLHFYVIDLKQKKILQTNDPNVQPENGTCFTQLFNKELPCQVINGQCLCEQVIANGAQNRFLMEMGEKNNKKFFRADVKNIGEDRVVATYSDITAETIAAKEMKINNRRLQRAEKLTFLGSWEIDLDTKMIYGTEGARTIYGVKNRTISLDGLIEILLPEYRKPILNELSKLVEGKGNFNVNFKIKRPDNGEIRNIHAIAEYRESKNMVFGVSHDITEQLKTEKEVNEMNLLFSTLIDNIPDAIYMKDTNYRKIIANKADVINCGARSVDDIIGKTDDELYPKEIAEKYNEDDRQVIEHGKAVVNREEMLPGNPNRWILTTKVPLKKSDGEVTGLVGIGHDITLRKKMVEELEEARKKAEESDRLKSLFLANMSHEIRTPLNAILGFSNIICSGNIEPNDLNYFGKIIENSGQRLTAVIDDIIDISLIQSNQLKIDYSTFDINELLQELHVVYKTQKADKLSKIDLKLKLCLNEESCMVRSDKNRLYQIFKNLLDNAFKFTEEGFIELGCLVSNGEIVLFVKDSGVGIDPKKATIIFEPFRQVEEGISRKHEGSGLGLAIISGITERLGGKAWVNSEPGKGSAFYVSVPRNFKDEKTSAENGKLSNKAAGENGKEKISTSAKTIVSFEDDPASIEYLKSVIKILGFKHVNFMDANEGIGYLKNNIADLVLMDVQLPGMNGYDATRIIKTEFPNLPVIIQTAYAMKGDRDKAFQAGCDDYLAKPVLLKDFKEKINKFIDQSIN